MKYTLYINGSAVDIDTSSLILYNYTRDEASNPTVVKNSYSQKVTLPGTPANNKIFSHFYRSDYATSTGRFNPIAKTPFEIRNEMSEVVESGYVKMESVERKGADVVNYTISLIGGLGGFFYELMYDEDGNEKTLANLNYDYGGNAEDPSEISYPPTAANVKACWDTLATDGYGGSDVSTHRLLNFIPCNNGLPSCNFDAKKAIYSAPTNLTSTPRLYNITNRTTSEGVTYGPKSDAIGYILLEMENEHSEWEMQDLRAYLQRPAISIKGLLETLTFQGNGNTGDYTFELDSDVFDESNKWYYYGWMTLPMFDRDNIEPANATLADYLTGTKSMTTYLLGLAKMFGLVFLYDGVTKTVTLTCRDLYYYNSTPVDISARIDTSSIKAVPTNISKRWYVFQDTMVDAQFTDAYAEKYGKEYGAQWVDTGYQFNNEKSDVLDGSPFKGAADVMESMLTYCVNAERNDGGGVDLYFKMDLFETVKWELYNGDNALDMSSRRLYNSASREYYYEDGSYNGLMSMPQFHDSDNKAKDGSGVLLLFDKMQTTRTMSFSGASYQYGFYLTDDISTVFSALNEGTPCWIVTGVRNDSEKSGWGIPYVLTSIPSFRRWAFNRSTRAMTGSLDFGNVQEEACYPEPFVANKGVYHQCWQKYIEDRCHVDTRVVTCKVDFTGMLVNADTLRRFYWFDNALWALNKIKNHCYTKQAPTECEFIKVQDITNYTQGQDFNW